MRQNRVKLVGTDACYHCVTRTVNGEFLLDNVAKEVLRKQLWVAADFCGLEILTYCIMSNHFHVLVRVPVVETAAVSDIELMRRYRLMYPKPTKYQVAKADVLEATLKAGGQEAEDIRASLLRRMHDVSEFMKTVKQRFSVWYNRSHNRYGTLWAERFKSVLVEGKGDTLTTMSLYIDLNPVRAGLVQDPKDYRFCGYAEALSGHVKAQAGIGRVMTFQQGRSYGVEDALCSYRRCLFGKGSAMASGKADASCLSPEKAVEVIEKEKGRVPRAVALRLRVRYFSDGCVLGSKAFIQEHLNMHGHPNRLPQPLKGSDWNAIHSSRSLRRNIFACVHAN